jgi:hypothetical protein
VAPVTWPSPVDVANTIDDAKRAFEIAGRGCLVRMGEDEPRYATVAEIAPRLEPHEDATMLLTAVSDAVEKAAQRADTGGPPSSADEELACEAGSGFVTRMG